jgi:hypothetical protein
VHCDGVGNGDSIGAGDDADGPNDTSGPMDQEEGPGAVLDAVTHPTLRRVVMRIDVPRAVAAGGRGYEASTTQVGPVKVATVLAIHPWPDPVSTRQ